MKVIYLSDLLNLREYALSNDEFGKPKIYVGQNAVVTKLVELALLEKGTYPSRPNMGLGIVSTYRYTSEDKISDMETAYKDQIETYLPELSATEVSMVLNDKILNIYVTVDKTVYSLAFDTENNTLESL